MIFWQAWLTNFGDTAENRRVLRPGLQRNRSRAEAIAEFHRAMALDPRAPDAHYYLGLAYLGHNESAGYAQAIPEFHAEAAT